MNESSSVQCKTPSHLRLLRAARGLAGFLLSSLLLFSLLFFLGVPRLGAQPSTAVVDGTPTPVELEIFSSWAERQRQHLGQPGVAIGIVVGDSVVWARGFGQADRKTGVPVTPETVFRLGSISKTFTAVATLILRDEGKLALGDPVRTYLPWLEYDNPFPEEGPVTLWHLLTHTSGLPREAELPYWTDRRFPDLETLRRNLPHVRAIFAPGTGYQYSNLGMGLLGAAVSAAAGQPYEQVIEDRIFGPLGMESSSVHLEQVDATRLATGYLVERQDETGAWYAPEAPDTRSRALSPAADLSSSVRDLARYLSALFPASERQLLSASTLREMQRIQWLSDSWQSGRGLGFSIQKREERVLVGHGGWVAGYRTEISFDPQARLGVIVLTNSDQGGPSTYVDQLVDYVLPALRETPHNESSSAGSYGVSLDRLAGRYSDPWGAVSEIVADGDSLLVYEHSYPPTRSLLGAVERLERISDVEFLFPGQARKPLTFELDSTGRPRRVKNGPNYLFPEGCGSLTEDLFCSEL